MSVRPFGDRVLLIELEQRRDPVLVARSRAIADAWEARGLGPAVPAYASAVVRFDPARTPYADALRAAEAIAAESAALPDPAPGGLIEVATRYDGPDLAETAARSGLDVAELVALHAAGTYTAWFLGFMPGFAYLGPLDPRIAAPRRAAPRRGRACRPVRSRSPTGRRRSTPRARLAAGSSSARPTCVSSIPRAIRLRTVSAESDRMGTRLAGRRIEALAGEILTCGIVAGAIRVPRGGEPIVLLADHQTTGGYPIAATVVSADLGLVAQRAPGEPLQLVRVTAAPG